MNILKGQNLFDVSGKVVLITGAATGLGEGLRSRCYQSEEYPENGC